jgi:stage IV sporulation protein FB
MTRGAITLARYRGAPIRLHWTVPVVALMAGGLRFAPGAWLGLVLVVLLHEMGHAFWARRFQMDVTEILIHGLGGHCAYLGTPSPKQRSIVAWGGVMAQAVVFCVALPLSIAVPATSEVQRDLYGMLISTNLYIALFNLIPIRPLDGAEAWRLVPMLVAERSRRSVKAIRQEVARAQRAPSAIPSSPKPGQTLGDALSLGVVDERAVRDTVRRALEDAKRDSAPPRGPRSVEKDDPERH